MTIISSSNTLLESILEYVDDLKELKLGKKLSKISLDTEIAKQLGLSREFIFALSNSKVIRDVDLIHPKQNVQQSIPYICAVSYAYLVILVLKIMLSLGYFSTK